MAQSNTNQSNEFEIKYEWKNVSIGAGGYITGILFSKNVPNELYIRTDIGGAYRRTSDGKWLPLQDGLTRDEENLNGILSIAIDETNPNKIYMAAGTYTFANSPNAAILISNDKGKTWQKSELPFKLGANEDGRGSTERLAIDLKNSNRLWLGSTKNGLWRSNDGALNWSQIGFDKEHILFVLSTENGELWVSTVNGVFRSNDGGSSFQKIENLPTGLIANNAREMPNGDIIFTMGDAIGPNNIKRGAVIKYTSGRQIIDMTPKNLKSESFGYSGLSISQNANQITISTTNKWASGDEILTSKDGANWKSINTNSKFDLSKAPWLLDYSKGNFDHIGHWISDLEIDPFNENHALYVTGYGLWETFNFQAQTIDWNFNTIGIEETAILDLAIPIRRQSDNETPILLSAIGDISGFSHFSLDDNSKIKMHLPFMGNSRSIDVAQNNPMLLVRTIDIAPYGYLSIDGGKNWRAFDLFANSEKRNGGQIRLSSDAKTIVWLIGGECYYSNDMGQNWTKSDGLGSNIENSRLIADKTNGSIFYVYDLPTGRFYKSENGTKSFEKANINLTPWSNSIASVPENPMHVWAATYEGLKASDDGGANFTKIAPFDAAWGVAFGKAASGESYPNLFVAGKIGSLTGIFMSPNMGEKWLLISNKNQQFSSLRVMQGDPNIFGRLYVGTDGRGIFYGDISIKNANTRREK